MGSRASWEHEEAVPTFGWRTVLSVTQLEIDQTDFSNVDEPAMSLGIESWRNMVGGGTISGLRSVIQKWNHEVLLGHTN